MTGSLWLDWAVFSVSLFNAIVLLWLGLTVLLNAERRTWGIWLAGSGLLLGGLFFISHSAILGHTPVIASRGLDFWWRVGWLPVMALPLAWYVLMLWYAGFWSAADSFPLQRHRLWLTLMVLLGGMLSVLIVGTDALPSYGQLLQADLSAWPALAGVPLVLLAYPPYAFACMLLAWSVLWRTEPLGRLSGALARERARPWLLGSSMALLVASLLVAWAMANVVLMLQTSTVSRAALLLSTTLAWLDLLAGIAIGTSTVLLGQAIVSYEVFTGKTLPRQGFRKHWRRIIILGLGYSGVVGWSLAINLRPVYALLLTLVLMVAFYALLVWRSFADRERSIEQLWPFVTSQRLYTHLVDETADVETEAVGMLRALSEVLGATHMHLLAFGPFAAFVGRELHYPAEAKLPPLSREIQALFAKAASERVVCLPIDLGASTGRAWAIPVYGSRGVEGALVLGEKVDGGLYTDEEVEMALAAAERLIDIQAGTQIGRRLMALQRQRMSEGQVADFRTRRVLHDDVLPGLHAAILMLSATENSAEVPALLADLHRKVADLLRELPVPDVAEVKRFGLVEALRRMLQSELADAFEMVVWQIDPLAAQSALALSSLVAEVTFYAAREAIRNAARYARSEEHPLQLCLRLSTMAEGLWLQIEDNGPGFDRVPTADAGSGQGLALHSTMIAVVGGSLAVEPAPIRGTRVTLYIPASEGATFGELSD